ncbi:FtsX-like permease family protein [Isoptericola sp. b441]|uniref:FtsX-like permease family protein n=1 Tax=Actinotalea lenta TaxID=3064654 RepID=A0ABT9D9W0_9CELL|nr:MULTISPECIES: FtsX-like permease family protein [unclassified Isoptericola]MDO8107286.1 FtsX-like permease family protein [Isoptericola sp. b441]MDO8121052.1 FtsX-like permease family protein [Isoptericola sp. b490]
MTRVGLRGIRAHLGRFLMSVVAVLLGVAFVAGTFALRTMMSATFDRIVDAGTVGDVYVRGPEVAGGGGPGGDQGPVSGTTRSPIPLSLTDRIATVAGVTDVVPDISGPIVLVGADGTATSSGNGAPSFAMALEPGDPSLSVAAGRAPRGPGEIALESSTMAASGLSVGDTTSVVLGGTVQQATVVGEVRFGAPIAGATIVFLDPKTARQAYAPDGTTSSIAVYADAGISESTLADRVRQELSGASGVQVVTGDTVRTETKDQIASALGFVSTFLLVFAGISLFVGGFLIANTFQMIVRQRQREFAMLRAIGASPTQVFGSILVQAAVVGLLGSGLGIGAGVALVAGLRVVLDRMGMELSGEIPLDGFTVVIALVVGVTLSVLAALVPARRAALTPPVEAMRDDVATHDRASVLRAVAGGVLALAGVGAVLAASVGDLSSPGPVLGLGAACLLLGTLMLAPSAVPGGLRLLAAPAAAALRPLGGLARGNVTRNPRRTASTASALMIGMALVGAASVLAASTQASTRTIVDSEATADFLLQSATRDVPADLASEVSGLPGVGHVDTLHVGPATVGGRDTFVTGVDPGVFDHSLDVPVDSGDTAALASGEIVVLRSMAAAQGWAVGDTVEVTGGAGSREVRIGAIIDSRSLQGTVIAPQSLFDAVVPPAQGSINTVFVEVAAGADGEQVRAELTAAAKPYVVVSVLDKEQFADRLAEQVNQILVILYALLGLSIVIAALGIVNTLALSIAERTREIGLLRAVGLGRLQLATVVTIESVLTAVFGTVLGVAIGAGLASTLPTVFADQGLSTLVVPWGQLGVFLGVAVAVGVVAAVWPGVRAARLDVLEAISYE